MHKNSQSLHSSLFACYWQACGTHNRESSAPADFVKQHIYACFFNVLTPSTTLALLSRFLQRCFAVTCKASRQLKMNRRKELWSYQSEPICSTYVTSSTCCCQWPMFRHKNNILGKIRKRSVIFGFVQAMIGDPWGMNIPTLLTWLMLLASKFTPILLRGIACEGCVAAEVMHMSHETAQCEFSGQLLVFTSKCLRGKLFCIHIKFHNMFVNSVCSNCVHLSHYSWITQKPVISSAYITRRSRAWAL